MKMKRLLTLTLAGMMVAGTSLSAAAANNTPGFNPPEQEEKEVEFDADEYLFQDQTIPVYGYVGPDAVLLDEEPDNEEVPPTPIRPEDVEYQINVSVPVKILWAVFEKDTDTTSGIGTVTSPDYYIRNNSEQLSVSITALSFKAKTYKDNTYVDDNWYEDLTLARKENSIMNRNVVLDNQAYVNMGNLMPEQQMEFDVQGKLDVTAVDNAYKTLNSQNSILDTSLDHALQPQYELILKIGALTN